VWCSGGEVLAGERGKHRMKAVPVPLSSLKCHLMSLGNESSVPW
jgi:hypothetical protein